MIKKFKKIFTEHPESAEETYFGHMLWAILYSLSLIVAGIVCAVHSVFPFLFKKTASSITEWVLDSNGRRRSDYDE
jgi:hypothetical protein